MAFNADLQILTQPGADGDVTYNLSAGFDPKAVILWGTPQTADGSAASYAFGLGFGTYRGSVVQQAYNAIRGLDGATSADTASGTNTDALFVLHTQSAGSAARDLEIDLTSMAQGAGSNVVLNWVNRHTTASVRIFMLVLGGSEISDALVSTYTIDTADTTDDVTVVAGFGKPELVFMIRGRNTLQDTAANSQFGFGFAKQGEAGRCYAFAQTDGNTNSLTATTQRSDRLQLGVSDGGGTNGHIARLDTTVSNWPTDGFRVLYDANPGNANIVPYLALRTTAQITTGANTALTAGADQDNAAGFTPKLGFLFGWNLAANAAIVTSEGAQCGFGIGAFDGTDEAWAGFTEDDGAGTMDSNNQQVDDKIIHNYSQAAALQSEADASFSGDNLRLTWGDLDTVAREYQWLAMGDAAAAPTGHPAVKRMGGVQFAHNLGYGVW
jgi:hypothetical protein